MPHTAKDLRDLVSEVIAEAVTDADPHGDANRRGHPIQGNESSVFHIHRARHEKRGRAKAGHEAREKNYFVSVLAEIGSRTSHLFRLEKRLNTLLLENAQPHLLAEKEEDRITREHAQHGDEQG